jgi:hypothetical protein
MQKRNKQASILLWSLFLSAFITSLFIFVSSSVQKNIKNTLFLSDIIDKPFILSHVFFDKNIYSLDINENEHINKNEEGIFSLSEWKASEFRFERFLSSLSWSLQVKNWWPVWYNFVDIDISPFSSTSVNSWVIFTGSTFTGMISPWIDRGILYIKNLGGHTSFSIKSDIPFLSEETEYQVIKKIAGTDIEKNSLKKRNFFLWDFPWLDYLKFGMEF